MHNSRNPQECEDNNNGSNTANFSDRNHLYNALMAGYEEEDDEEDIDLNDIGIIQSNRRNISLIPNNNNLIEEDHDENEEEEEENYEENSSDTDSCLLFDNMSIGSSSNLSVNTSSSSMHEMRGLLSSSLPRMDGIDQQQNDDANIIHRIGGSFSKKNSLAIDAARHSFEDVMSRAKECIQMNTCMVNKPSPLGNRKHSLNQCQSNGDEKSRHRHHEFTDNAEEIMARTLTHIDTIEDEFDELTHKRLLPVNLQIALEENVFGWSNLMSDILGHIFYPLISAWVTYKVITFCYDSFGLLKTAETNDDSVDSLDLTQVQANQGFDTFLIGLRNIWTLASLITTYRTVRRRRKVWLTHSDKKSLQAVDRTTKMGHKWREHKTRQNLRRKIAKAAIKYDAKLLKSKQIHEASELPLHVIARIPLVKNMLYSHGGYFAAAPYMLHDPQWIYILRQLMPDVYVEVARRVHLDSAKLIHWAENNPVVAAYGTLMSQNINGHSVALEWDVFLDPILVTRLIKALDVKESLVSERSSNKTPRRHISTKHIDSLNKLIRSRTLNLVANMLIAHGNATQLMMEQFSKPHFIKSYNFTRVKRACKTLGGGIEVWRWLAIYAEALKMGRPTVSRAGSDDEGTNEIFSTLIDEIDNDHYESSMSEFSSNIGNVKRIPVRKSVSSVRNLMGCELTVLLDVKSRHVEKRVWVLVIAALQEIGIAVEGIASFFMDDIRGVSDMLTSQGYQPVREVTFFHSVGDLQYACHTNCVRDGDTVLFNSGSLFSSKFPVERLREYKGKYKFNIGLYTQEFAVDPASAQIIVSHVNDNPDLYDHGLCWGGVNGVTVRSIQPGRFTSTDGLWNQRYLGKYWRHDIEIGDSWDEVGGRHDCGVLYGTFQ